MNGKNLQGKKATSINVGRLHYQALSSNVNNFELAISTVCIEHQGLSAKAPDDINHLQKCFTAIVIIATVVQNEVNIKIWHCAKMYKCQLAIEGVV